MATFTVCGFLHGFSAEVTWTDGVLTGREAGTMLQQQIDQMVIDLARHRVAVGWQHLLHPVGRPVPAGLDTGPEALLTVGEVMDRVTRVVGDVTPIPIPPTPRGAEE